MCPHFPGTTQIIHWSFTEPATLTGSQEEKLSAARKIRDEIREAVLVFVNQVISP